MNSDFIAFAQKSQHFCVIQAENPDGDSLGAALALDYLLADKQVSLYCPVDIPKYLHYYPDWSRVEKDFDYKAEAYIIVDTAASVLLSKLLEDPVIKNELYSKPVFVLDHHETPDDLDFPHEAIIDQAPSCCNVIYQIAKTAKWPISPAAADALVCGILSDTLGLSSQSVNSETFRVVAELMDLGANVADIEERRREFMKKSPRILDYKADLIKRIDYALDGKIATVHIPWEEIKLYSDEYNPNVLILEEMRLVEEVEVAVAIKTYPDGKVTGKIRTTVPIADQVAGFYGGGGHSYAAGFRTYDTSYEQIVADLVRLVPDLLSKVEQDVIL